MRAIIYVHEMQFGSCLMLEQLMPYSYVNCKKSNWQKGGVYTWPLRILKKSFYCAPMKAIWWELRVVKIVECIITLVSAMYKNATSKVKVDFAYVEM